MSELVSSLKEQAKAILVMMGVAIVSVLAMVLLSYFKTTIAGMPGLGNGTGSINISAQAVVDLFITAFGLTGAFASVTVLIIVIKGIIGVVRGLKT